MNNLLYPITFSIPSEKIIINIPNKLKLLSDLIPGKIETYIYNTEEDYYKEYQKSYFALTFKKGGWDGLRHYEIIANGCIPYFSEIEKCPNNTLHLFPKELILKGNEMFDKFNLIGINNLTDNDKNNYNDLLKELLDFLRKNLTTESIAKYILNKSNKINCSKILYLSGNIIPDYLRCLTLHGFKSIFGNNCHDYPKINHIYKNENIAYSNLYGKGITYTNLLPSELHNDKLDIDILNLIKNKYFDVIIYGSFSRGMPFYEEIKKIYNSNDVILLYGEDEPRQFDYFNDLLTEGHQIFVRELI